MRRWTGVALAALLAAAPVHADEKDPNAATRLLPATANGSLVYRVFVYLENPGDDAARNEAVRREVADAFPLQSGASFEEMLAVQGVRKVRALPDVASAEYRVYKSPEAGKILGGGAREDRSEGPGGSPARLLERQPLPARRAHEDRPGLLQVHLQRRSRALPRQRGLVREAPAIRRGGLRATQSHLLGRDLRRGRPRRRARALGHPALPLRFRHLPRQHSPRFRRLRSRPHDLGRVGEGLRWPPLRAEGVLLPRGPLRRTPALRGEQRLPREPDPWSRERLLPRRQLHRRAPRLPEHRLAEGARRRPHGAGVLPAAQRAARGETPTRSTSARTCAGRSPRSWSWRLPS